MTEKNDTHRYDDIIELPHHQSVKHPHMSMHDRAAQFSPFAALNGHAEAVQETARLTERKKELSEDEKEILDRRLHIAEASAGADTFFTFTYFVPDEKKSGGRYISYEGSILKVDKTAGIIRLQDHTVIDIGQITKIKSSIFDD